MDARGVALCVLLFRKLKDKSVAGEVAQETVAIAQKSHVLESLSV